MPGSVRKAQCGGGIDDIVQQTKCKAFFAKNISIEQKNQIFRRIQCEMSSKVSVYDYDPKS